MKQGARGSLLPLALFLTMAFGLFTRLAIDVMVLTVARQRAMTAGDFGLLSALRVRAKSLEAIAERWEVFGAPLVVAGGSLEASASDIPDIVAGAQTLQRSLSGYQGRITSALTVATEANGADRTAVTTLNPDGLRLNIEGQHAVLSAPGGPAIEVDSLWYRRTWGSRTDAGSAAVAVSWRAPRLGGEWLVTSTSSARLVWDADLRDLSIDSTGNGGYAFDWASASAGELFRPHRFPFFRAEALP